jgi:hypothetical protein
MSLNRAVTASYGASGSKRTRPDSVEANESGLSITSEQPVNAVQEVTFGGSGKQSKRVRAVREEAKDNDGATSNTSEVNIEICGLFV